MVFFIAETHFDHENILSLFKRPFGTIEQMNEAIIENWNRKITGNDTVYITGDIFFRSKDPEAILRRLHGKKHLAIGNHDTWIKHVNVDKYFKKVGHYLTGTDGYHGLVMCHYPQIYFAHPKRFYAIHGHIHANTDDDIWPALVARDHVLNASVDINGFAPVTFDELYANNARFKAAHSSTALKEI